MELCSSARARLRREPERGVLHRILLAHLETFLARSRCHGRAGLPRFVERELYRYLQCGLLAFGFARVHCATCKRDDLVAFSCKGRGFCPSCGGRRMSASAAHLVDEVLPDVPVRQWVLSFPFRIRYLLAYDPKLCCAVRRIFVRSVLGFLERQAREQGHSGARSGAVIFVQRFGSAPNLDEPQRQRIMALATDFPTVWRDPNTPQRERKRMLALLIEDVTLIKQREITAQVRFRGGATTTLTLPRPLTAQQMRATHAEVRQEIDTLLDEYTDAQVASILNQRGLRTGAGDVFDPAGVQWVRFSAKFKSLKERLLEAGMLTGKQIYAKLGVGRSTLARWRVQQRIKARICNDHGEWLYWPPQELSTSDTSSAHDSVGTSTAGGAV